MQQQTASGMGQGYMPCWGMMGQMPMMGHGGVMMGPGMMGQGMMGQGQGMMGPGMMGMGPGMMGMGPGMMGMGMMGQGGGMMGPGMMMGPMMGMGQQPANLTVDDVKGNLERWLAWHGNARLKVGNVLEKDQNTITAEIVTVDKSLVQKFDVDRRTGTMWPVR
jgi:hypothetical protein